jgi:acetyl esterase/lipase
MAKDITVVHPELREMAKMFPKLPFRRWNIRFFRWLAKFQPQVKRPDTVHIEEIYIQSQDPEHKIRLRIYKPRRMAMPSPILVWMHGGGYLIGQPEQNDAYMFRLVQELGIMIVSIDYRLAPEHPFPTPLEDCYTALKWVHDQAERLGIAPNRIAIGGESAGGGLAASLVQLAHDRGEVHPIFQLLVYPMLDDRTTLRKDIRNTAWITWTVDNNRLGWEAYLKQVVGSGDVPAYSVPSRRESLSGLPPAWIGVGTLDLFYEENLAYAQALQSCGVDCEIMIIPGAFHGFDQFDPKITVVEEFRKSQIQALKKHLFPG